MNSTSLSVEQLVGHSLGSYRVEQLLGHGNVNAVYLARHMVQQQPVMLTAFLLPPEYSPQLREKFKERFTRVASALTKLQHSRVLPTYDFGEQFGFPYLVAPLITSGSLAKVLKQQPRLSPSQALDILRPIAEGFDYAHGQGVVHGTLKSTNILLDQDGKIQIAGFGLANILELRGLEQVEHPYAHLFSIARTFLGSPEYIAPEVVQGAPFDALADVYALGAMLFELLSGKPPFSGADPMTTALRHVQQPAPSLLTFCPELSPALDLIVQKALEPERAQRYQSAGSLVTALERVLQVIDSVQLPAVTPLPRTVNRKSPNPPPTLSPANDWLNEDALKAQQADSAMQTAQMPTTPQFSFPSQQTPGNAQELLDSPEDLNVDPFVWWSTTSLGAVQNSATSSLHKTMAAPLAQTGNQPSLGNDAPTEMMTRAASMPPLNTKKQSQVDKGRRRTVALLAGGGVAMVAALGFGGITLAQRLQSAQGQARTGAQQAKATTPASPTKKVGSTPTAKPAPTEPPTQTAQPAPTQPPTPTAPPTQPPPTPTPVPGHTGTVVGSTNQANNSSKTFTNPADGNDSLLIRLPNGNFVAFESDCPHEGVTCHYDADKQKIICPRHDAYFDPFNNAAVLQGPPKRPLTAVAVKVNADGTVTTGG
jgi:serine/threonine protein kinase/nitrite reductase/ring-hydroxylating ferredoxin subunit